MLLTQLIALC